MPLDLGELLSSFWDHRVSTVRVGGPARVLAYDSATQRARVELLNDPDHPQIANVPVVFGVVTFPLVAGSDEVFVLCADRSMDEVKAGEAAPARPADPRTHEMIDAIAFPMRLSSPLPSAAYAGGTVVNGSDLRLGSSAATKALVQSGNLEAILTSIVSKIDILLALHTLPPSGIVVNVETTTKTKAE